MRFNYDNSPSETDRICAVLETAPDLPTSKSEDELCDWVWSFVQGIKRSVIYHHDHGYSPWTADDVKRALMTTLKSNMVSRRVRQSVVDEYNRALGGGKFPKDWPETICFTVNAYAVLPKLDREVFRNRAGYSPCYPKLLAALYMAGINNDEFIFAFPAYGILFDCNRKLVSDLMGKVMRLGIVVRVKRGRFIPTSPNGKHKGSKCSWYTLTDPDSLLNLFWFTTVDEKKKFISHFGSIKNPIKAYDWKAFVITNDWLRTNRLK